MTTNNHNYNDIILGRPKLGQEGQFVKPSSATKYIYWALRKSGNYEYNYETSYIGVAHSTFALCESETHDS